MPTLRTSNVAPAVKRLLAALVLVSGSACKDGFFVSPASLSGRSPAGLALSYSLATGSRLAPDRLRIRVSGTGVSIDTVVSTEPAVETRVRLQVGNASDDELYQVVVELRRDAALLFRGSTSTPLKAGKTTPVEMQLDAMPAAARSLAVGQSHSCALDETGNAFCWGSNRSGQLGRGTIGDSTNVPIAVASKLAFAGISAGGNLTCAVTLRGVAYCWGNVFGTVSGSPVLLPGSVAFTSISASAGVQSAGASGGFACGLDVSGAAYCIGRNQFGQLGKGDTLRADAPTPVAGGLRFQSIETGLQHTCGIVTDGRAFCWGGNTFRETGVAVPAGTVVPLVLSPTPVTGGLLFTSIAPGAGATCATTQSLTYCWGTNSLGVLANGTQANANTLPTLAPAPIAGNVEADLVRAATGNTSTPAVCGLIDTGAAFCWGSNATGQLGTTLTLPNCGPTAGSFCSVVPIAVAGGLTFATVAPAVTHTCAMTPLKRVYCWGLNSSGQLGNGSNTSSPVPVPVALPTSTSTLGSIAR